jgi:hypothetical protein
MLKLSTLVATAYAFAIRSRTDLKLEAKRASVSDVAPRDSVTSTGEKSPRQKLAANSSKWRCAASRAPRAGSAGPTVGPISTKRTSLTPMKRSASRK